MITETDAVFLMILLASLTAYLFHKHNEGICWGGMVLGVVTVVFMLTYMLTK